MPLKPKPALGVAWTRATYDIHVSLQHAPGGAGGSNRSRLEQQGQHASLSTMPKLQGVVRATLEQHPFQNCKVEPPIATDFCITPKGIQDYQPVPAMEREED
jgi:hypothetical protein